MTAFIHALRNIVTTQIVAVLSRTASSVSSGIDVSNYEGTLKVILAAGAATAGTNPTLDVKVQECATSNGSPTDVTSGAFTQVTTTAGVQTLNFDVSKLKKYVFVAWTLGGTNTPTFPFGAAIQGTPKY